MVFELVTPALWWYDHAYASLLGTLVANQMQVAVVWQHCTEAGAGEAWFGWRHEEKELLR